MSKRKSFQVPLTLDDELIYTFGWDDEHHLVTVSVHFRARIHGRWHEVCRYDNAHGPPHIHWFWMSDPIERLPATLPPDELVRRGKADLVENWQRYRQFVEARL